MKEFEERLIKNRNTRANIEVIHRQPSSRNKLVNSITLAKNVRKSAQIDIDSHRWLQVVDEFADGTFNLISGWFGV